MRVKKKLIAKVNVNKIKLKAIATSKLPLPVSSTVAVVSTRV
jgi:hypothetical protein